MLWIIWILVVLGVIASQVDITMTIVRVRFKMESLQKQVAKMKMDDKVARGNLDIAKRGLSEIQRMIPVQMDVIAKLTKTIAGFKELSAFHER